MEVRYNAKNASKPVFSKTPIYFVFERETIGCWDGKWQDRNIRRISTYTEGDVSK